MSECAVTRKAQSILLAGQPLSYNLYLGISPHQIYLPVRVYDNCLGHLSPVSTTVLLQPLLHTPSSTPSLPALPIIKPSPLVDGHERNPSLTDEDPPQQPWSRAGTLLQQ